MSTREVILTGGSPWGFRMHGGCETGQPLRISRVNPGSKAAQKGVREGDVISSINGQPTRTLSNSDAHALLRNAGQSLRLGLNEDCGGSPKRRSYKMATSQSSSASIQSELCRNDTGKRASAPTGGECGGPSKESGEESKHPDKGVWTPSKSAEDLRAQPLSEPSEQKERSVSTKEVVDFGSKEDVAPVWVPKSAGPSPTAERKEFKPVNFDASTLTKNKEGYSRSLASPAPEESFAWQSKESETSKSVSVTTERRSFVQSPTSPGASFTSHLPRAQNPTITLLQKAREGQLPRGAHYLDEKEKMGSKENDGDIMYSVRKEYETEDEKRKRKIVELAPKKFEGIGPTTKEGIPIILRSGIKEENQAKWYKKMYESLHCPGKDDEYVTVRYKTRRGRYPYTSAEGYLSEPDPIGYDSDMGYSAKYATLDRRRIKNKDYNFTTSTMPRSKYIPPSTKYGPEVYKNQPGRIEDYEPGHSSIADKEAKLWWDEVLDIFDGWLDTHSQEPYRFLLDWIQERHATQNTPPSKPFMTHALKESGYESDSTLLFKRREENMQSLSPLEQKQAYKTIQMGGEVPLHGLRKPAPERPKEPVIGPVPIPKPRGTNQRDAGKESPHKYVESEVTIHYRSPIRAQAKEALPEEELARRQEEAMRRIYQEERRRKYLQELQDMESRRHTDNFTPSQKSPIPLNRYDNFLDEVPSKSKVRDHTPEPKVVARALYNFVGQTSRELSFRRGDIIFVRRQIDKNWYEGEHNAMIGLFPFNYVEIIPYDGIRTIPKRPTEGQARAKYNFVAQTHLELSLIKGELVVLTRQVDNNWFEGRIGSRRGIFPISYVEVLVEPGERPVTPSSKPATLKSLTSPVSSSLLLNGSSVLSNTPHNQQPYHQQYIGKQQKQYQSPVSYSTQKTTTFTSSLGRNPYSSKTRPSAAQKLQIPSVNQTLHIDTHSDPVPYRALYNYKPQNEDELELQEGDTVYVMEKCDDGWYVGSSHRTGYFGTFPGNYVERI
ncbi:vinexin isoform X3 [Hetaerina americana]|uniref:vinexin isoform X3 n=1 Tax=Hetaerina americana TaxID=62018 RepID=UPI003A7F3EFE